MRTETLIIGAGPAGLATAMELSKKGKQFIIIEKSSTVGGLAKTYEFREGDLIFRTDNGPHRFFSKNPYLYSFIEELLQEKWIEVKRQTRQFIGGKFYDYPIRPVQALANIGVKKAAGMIFDYSIAQIQYKIFKKDIKNFEDFIIANFGKSLGRFNMINYTEKIWGVPASTIHSDWARQRIKGLSVPSLIKTALHGLVKNIKTENVRTLINTFYYPEYGSGLTYEAIKEVIEKNGYELSLNTYPVSIKHENNKITEVILNNSQIINPTHLVESIPIKDFLRLLNPLPPDEILEACEKFKYRDQVYLFLTLDKNRITNDQWIYFPEKHIPFGRISEMKNFSQKMCPPGKTSLFIEFFCFKGDEIWQKSKEELLELTMSHLEPMGFCKREEIRNSYLIKQEKVYPIYDTNYKGYLSVVKNYLNKFENLYYIGRPGRFRYNNQDHSLEMGMLAAQSIISGKKEDIEQVGSEQEYYEEIKTSPKLFYSYVVCASIATIIDLTILYSLTEFFNFWYFNAAIFGYFGGIITNFTLQKYFTFKNSSKKILSQFGLFLVVALIGLGLNQLIIYALVEFAGLWYILAKLFAIAAVMSFSFYGHKNLTFKTYE